MSKARYILESEDKTYGKFVIEPIPEDEGAAFGNALRKTLLSQIEGAAVTSVKIKGIPHEFAPIDGVVENTPDVLRNIGNLIIRSKSPGRKRLHLSVEGGGEVKAKDIKTDGEVEIINPHLHIATLNDGAKFEAEMTVETGIGWRPPSFDEEEGISLTANFSPVKRVAFKTEGESLSLEIRTNGALTPLEAFLKCAEVLGELLESPLISGRFDSNFGRFTLKEKAGRLLGHALKLRLLKETLYADYRCDGEEHLLEVKTNGKVSPRDALDAALDHLKERIQALSKPTLEAQKVELHPPRKPSKPVIFGDISFADDVPDLREAQLLSFRRFLEALPALLDETLRMEEDGMRLELLGCNLGRPKFDEEECLKLDLTYSAPVKLILKLAERVSGEMIEEMMEAFELPLMTEEGFFIISGQKRVIVGDIVGGDTKSFNDLTQKKVRFAGEVLRDLLSEALKRLREIASERLGSGMKAESISELLEFEVIGSKLREFFSNSPLSQVLQETNPLDRLTHIRRLRQFSSVDVKYDEIEENPRLIHPSHFGRICYIETPEGPSVGLIGSLALYAKVDGDGNLSPASCPLSSHHKQQALGVSAALIPLIEHDDPNRALMGANMQRQAVPLLFPEKPLVQSGLERKVALDSNEVLLAEHSGLVVKATSREIVIRRDDGKTDTYRLKEFLQRCRVRPGRRVESGEIIAEGGASDDGMLSLGKNLLVAYMPWEGYNFEDAIVVSDRLLKEDVLTSVQIREFKVEVRKGPEGKEVLTRYVSEISEEERRKLDESGIVRVGSFVKGGDVLVGKIGPNSKDVSFRVPIGIKGKVISVERVTRKEVGELIIIRISERRMLEVGDKLTGRHGNKGVVGRIVPEEEMPFLPDGTPVDVILNPLGVPTRMNLGQIIETHLGWAADKLGVCVISPPFDGPKREEVEKLLEEASLPKDGMSIVFDGRTGRRIDTRVTVGYQYILKLYHMVSDKIHARSIGPYNAVTDEPVAGRSQFGGQMFGKMEIWALQAYGAMHTLQEVIGVKSNGKLARELYEAILSGKSIELKPPPEKVERLGAFLLGAGIKLETLKGGMRLRLLSPDEIRKLSNGEVKEENALDEETGSILRGGLFCERIFSDNGFGHIELASPVIHPWAFELKPNPISLLLDIGEEELMEIEAEELKGRLCKLDLEELARLDDERGRLARAMLRSKVRPEWMVLDVIPVIPTRFRPIVQLSGERFASSDLNELYRRVINRNNRLRRLIELQAPKEVVKDERKALQEAMNALFVRGARNLKSLSRLIVDELRENLTGRRVDYSGRSVIIPGPRLKLDECGLPAEMAFELFKPFVIRKLLEEGSAANVLSAKRMVDERSFEARKALGEVVSKRFVLLNRAPTLHRLNIQAFKPVLTEDKAIALHPLVCQSFNADFDGDQMAVHIPISDEAQREAQELMLSTRNIISPATGHVLAHPTLDMVLGCFYLTLERENCRGEGRNFRDAFEVKRAYELGEVELHARIKLNGSDTTVGRVIFNEILPEGIKINEPVDKDGLRRLAEEICAKMGREAAVEFLNRVDDLGFRFATLFGASLSIATFKTISAKDEILRELEEKDEKAQTDEERLRIRFEALERVKSEILKELSEDELNPLYLMLVSKARGNMERLISTMGTARLAFDPSMKPIWRPILGNFSDGLSPMEHFVISYGARLGLIDTAIKVKRAGWLMCRLVEAAQDVLVTEEDCGAEEGIAVKALYKDGELIEELSERIVGRRTLEDIVDPKDGRVIVKAGEEIDEDATEAIERAGIAEVKVRSPITCRTRWGICSKCYGRDLTRGRPVKVGEPVGVIAATSIGEPVIQLTFRTFHRAREKTIVAGMPYLEGLLEAREEALKDMADERELYEFLLLELTTVFRRHGVRLNDKHFEIIIRQMLSRVEITEPGDTSFYGGEIALRDRILEENERVLEEGGEPASYRFRLIGISEAALSTESFLTKAASKPTGRIEALMEAAITSKLDPLRGLRESLILGSVSSLESPLVSFDFARGG